jgi:iron complex transport system substrate-binding protein
MASAARGTLRQRVRGCEQRVGHARCRSASGAVACLVGCAALALALAAVSGCGSDPTAIATTEAGNATSTASIEPAIEPAIEPSIEPAGALVTAPAARIIPLDGDLAEIVFALGLGDQVVATDISATFPAEADALPEIGYQRALSAEPIAAFEPTVVLATELAGPPETLDELERLGIEVVMVDTSSTSDEPASKVRAVSAALGVPDVGKELALDIEAGIDAAGARVADLPAGPRVLALYLRGENVQLVLGEGSGIDWIIEFVGAIDVADELGVIDNAPLSSEAIVAAAPDVILVPSGGLESVGGVDGLLAIPGIAETPAGRDRRILAYDDQYLLGNGPRTPQLLDELITDLHGAVRARDQISPAAPTTTKDHE